MRGVLRQNQGFGDDLRPVVAPVADGVGFSEVSVRSLHEAAVSNIGLLAVLVERPLSCIEKESVYALFILVFVKGIYIIHLDVLRMCYIGHVHQTNSIVVHETCPTFFDQPRRPFRVGKTDVFAVL